MVHYLPKTLYTQGYNDRLPSGVQHHLCIKHHIKGVFEIYPAFSLHPGESFNTTTFSCLVAYAHVNSEISSFGLSVVCIWYICTVKKTSKLLEITRYVWLLDMMFPFLYHNITTDTQIFKTIEKIISLCLQLSTNICKQSRYFDERRITTNVPTIIC